MSMNQVILHGALEQRYGREFTMDAANPRECVRGLMVQLPGFEQMLRSGQFQVVRQMPNGEFALTEQHLMLGMDGAKLHLIPMVEGAGGDGPLKFLFGALLIAVQFIPGVNVIADATLFGSLTVGALATTIGISMALGGLAMMLSPTPKVGDTGSAVDQKTSALFSNGFGSDGQFIPVPIAYGKIRVPSIPVASRIDNNLTHITTTGTLDNPKPGSILGALVLKAAGK
jgi:predicted phage tail protein